MNQAFEAVHRGHLPKGPVNLTRAGGETLLMVAVDYAHFAVVDFLLSHGANPLARRWDGVTASDIARSFDPLLTERLVRAVNRFLWAKVKSIVRVLGLHTRAVVTANHPLRKKARKEFDL